MDQRQIEALVQTPREALEIEIKSWLDPKADDARANLAQALLALANHGGGYLLIGFSEDSTGWHSVPTDVDTAGKFTQDLINGVVARYAEPAFHCDVYHVRHAETGQMHPIIIVPGGHRVPIRAKRDGPENKHVKQGVFYIRRPGPCSEPPQTAREWDELITRCVRNAREELLDSIRSMIMGVQLDSSVSQVGPESVLDEWTNTVLERWAQVTSTYSTPADVLPFERGTWWVSYALLPEPEPVTPKDLLEAVRRSEGPETGWPMWWVPTKDEIRPYPHDGEVECWMGDTIFRDVAHADFWRASPSGRLFLRRGYLEDTPDSRCEPGTVFDVSLPIWRIGEAFLHAERMSRALDRGLTNLLITAEYHGLRDRRLGRVFGSGLYHIPGGVARQDSIRCTLETSIERIRDNLPELVREFTLPLYGMFDFAEVSAEYVVGQLAAMRKRS